MAQKRKILLGMSGWHYTDWLGGFYPPEVKGYNELRYFANHFNTVENNSSFYRISKESTYKTWDRMTPDDFVFSLKLNRFMTHIHRLRLSDEVIAKTIGILQSLQVLKTKLGTLLIQLPAAFKVDHAILEAYFAFLQQECARLEFPPDIAIEFRGDEWFTNDTYSLLRKFNIALVAAQSSCYPCFRVETADFVYIRLHGPQELFRSSYSDKQLRDWAAYITALPSNIRKVYVYFNNTSFMYSIENGKNLAEMLSN